MDRQGSPASPEQALGQQLQPDQTECASEDLNEPFHCFICLELVHKPIVNACGHMFCFWCVHLAMNQGTESYCPLCRRPYMHFPRICEQLHFLLLKAVPDAYRRRCREVYDEEAATNYFSPQLNDGLKFHVNGASLADEEASSRQFSPQFNDVLKFLVNGVDTTGVLSESTGVSSLSSERGVIRQVTEEDEVSSVRDGDVVTANTVDSSLSSSNLQTESDFHSREASGEVINIADGATSSSSTGVTVSDLLCTSCQKLLYRPVVLNCGHVYCEDCVTRRDDGGDAIIKCSTCGSIHPGTFPFVCLELHQYLEQNFSLEYENRKSELAKKSTPTISAEIRQLSVKKLNSQPPARMHPSVGCDGCGMYPILGARFQCTECPKRPGYDLCMLCYSDGTNLVGRFNQQHTTGHKMREVVGNSSHLDDEFQDVGEGSEGMETYFGIVGYFA